MSPSFIRRRSPRRAKYAAQVPRTSPFSSVNPSAPPLVRLMDAHHRYCRIVRIERPCRAPKDGTLRQPAPLAMHHERDEAIAQTQPSRQTTAVSWQATRCFRATRLSHALHPTPNVGQILRLLRSRLRRNQSSADLMLIPLTSNACRAYLRQKPFEGTIGYKAHLTVHAMSAHFL